MTFWETIKFLVKKGLIFLRDVHVSDNATSSKRFYGGIGFLAMLVLLYLVGYNTVSLFIWEKIQGTIEFVITICAGLIGLDTVRQIFDTMKGKKPPSE